MACGTVVRALVLATTLGVSGAAQARFRNDWDPFLIAGHAALGVSIQHPYLFSQLGVRIEEEHFFIGIELSSLLQAGFAADALFYVVRMRSFALHIIDPGVGWNAFGHYLSTPDVKRGLDLRIGAGFQIRACRHALATVDWKASLPDPGFVITSYGDYGKTIFLDSLKQGQLWLGVVLH
jgi:hypothetical protein